MTVIHSWGHGPGAPGGGPRIELEPGSYCLRSTDAAVKVQRCTHTVDQEETVEVPVPGRPRAPRAQQTYVVAVEQFEDFSTAGSVFTVDTAGAYRLFCGAGGAIIELEKMED